MVDDVDGAALHVEGEGDDVVGIFLVFDHLNRLFSFFGY
jgi:hypothetical protein